LAEGEVHAVCRVTLHSASILLPIVRKFEAIVAKIILIPVRLTCGEDGRTLIPPQIALPHTDVRPNEAKP
jgi:hypothetical protein